jgi:hypothetical protein
MRWRIGEFDLLVDARTVRQGEPDPRDGIVRKVSGRGWVRIPGTQPTVLEPSTAGRRFVQAVEVVAQVVHPETEIALADAQALRPGAAIGETVAIAFDADAAQLRGIIDEAGSVTSWLESDPLAALVAVEFRDLAVDVAQHVVVDGSVTYPVAGLLPPPLRIPIAGFTLVISRFAIFARRGFQGSASVILPSGVTDASSCGPAVIDLGRIALSPTGDYFFDEPDREYGPWLLGDTGMLLGGTGFTLDLSLTASAPGWPPAWRGLVLVEGTASGEQHVPEPCNSGYLRGTYAFHAATIDATGFAGLLELAAPISFTALNPFGQTFTFSSGELTIQASAIAAGVFPVGRTDLLPTAVRGKTLSDTATFELTAVSVQPDYSLSGVLDAAGARISWGELTHHGEEAVVWTAEAELAYLHLPGGSVPSYSPVSSGTFTSPAVSTSTGSTLAALAAGTVSGVTLCDFHDLLLFTPDRPGGAAAPFVLGPAYGWLRIGVSGVDGEMRRFSAPLHVPLGDPAGKGYVGVGPFDATLFQQDRLNLLADLVTSAAFDSHFGGSMNIADPVDIKQLPFTEMKVTSTACLVGGEVVLPPGGIPLPRWGLSLVSTAATGQAGVVSVRTGRILLTSGGIAEPLHFSRPIGLTWGEILANGQIGELFLDFDDWGQRFDGLGFHPREVTLAYPSAADAYLGVWGSVILPFFGPHDVNVRDGLPDPAHLEFTRWVTVPPDPITARAGPTELALSGVWHDSQGAVAADVECPFDVGYDETIQRGFAGTGTAAVGCLDDAELAAVVTMRDGASDVRFASGPTTHDFALPTVVRVGAMTEIAGSIRVEGSTVSRMNVFGMLEQSAAVGWLLAPREGYDVEVNTVVTATSLDFYASGDILLAVALTQVEASAVVHLRLDYAAHTAEGEVLGTVSASSAFQGLRGSGQLTWFVGPGTMYMQGRVTVAMFVALVSSETLEGGFFVGYNAPRAAAWVLDTTDPRFKISRSMFPASITGVYGYGRASYSKNFLVLASGGVDIFVGGGAFLDPLSGGAPLAPFGAGALPYVVAACGIGIHGEIAGGLVSASAWAELAVRGPIPLYFEGTFGLSGCVAWVLCASITLAARYTADGLELSD